MASRKGHFAISPDDPTLKALKKATHNFAQQIDRLTTALEHIEDASLTEKIERVHKSIPKEQIKHFEFSQETAKHIAANTHKLAEKNIVRYLKNIAEDKDFRHSYNIFEQECLKSNITEGDKDEIKKENKLNEKLDSLFNKADALHTLFSKNLGKLFIEPFDDKARIYLSAISNRIKEIRENMQKIPQTGYAPPTLQAGNPSAGAGNPSAGAGAGPGGPKKV